MKTIITLFFLTHFFLTSLAQDFEVPPPPPPQMEENGVPRKKLTPAELKLEVSEKAANLVKSPINGAEFNWSDANLWVCQDRKESDAELTAIYYFMNGRSEFKSDSVRGELVVQEILGFLNIDLRLDILETVLQRKMQSQFVGSEYKTISKKNTDKENRIIFKVDHIPITDDYFKTIIGEYLLFNGRILYLTYTDEALPEHIINMWVKRLENVVLR